MLNPTHIIGSNGTSFDERLHRAEHIIGAIHKGIVVLAHDQTISWANEPFRRWCAGDPIGKNFLEALNYPHSSHTPSSPVSDAFQAALAGSPTCVRLPQEHLILDITFTPSHDGDDRQELIAVCDDVTATVKRQQKLSALYKAGQELDNLDPDALTNMNFECRVDLLKQNIHKYIHNLLRYNVVEIRLYNPKTQELVPLMEEGMLPEAARRVLYAHPEGNGVTGYVAATKTAYLCSDASSDPLFLQGSAGVRSSMTVPILFHDELIGTFNVESPRPNAFGEEDLQFTELFSRELGRTLHTLNLLNEQELRTASSVIDHVNRDIALPTDQILATASTLLGQASDQPDMASQIQKILNDTRKLKAAVSRIQATVLGQETMVPDPHLAGQRILVLDPEERLRRSAHAIMERKGCIVETTGLAKEAIAMAQVGQYQTIMMSIKLKDMRGTETFLALAKAAPQAKIIFLRGFGHDSAHTEVNVRLAGYNPSVLFKPFQEEFLFAMLAETVPATV